MFFAELKRRQVFRVALAYVVASWLVVQVVANLAPLLDVPPWIGSTILLLLVAGFPVALVMAWAFDLTPEGLKRTESIGRSAPAFNTILRSRRLDFLIIGVLVLALGYFTWDKFILTTPSRATENNADGASMTATTLVVLPFANLSSEAEQEYFSDGLSEELMNQLGGVEGLRVTGRTSAFVFKGHNEDLRTIGEKLGVEHILEGSVRKAGDRLRINAQLVSAADGYRLWSETYERDLTDVFAIQEDVARAVTAALGVALGVGEPLRRDGGTSNPEAYDKYLRARALYHQLTSLPRAVEIYREALAIDPDFAQAWYGIYAALGYMLVGDATDSEVRTEMVEAGARIIALAPNAWWAHAVRADQFLLEHRWAEAEAALTAAFAAAPASDVDARVSYATFLMYVGRIFEAVELMERARESDPLSLRVSGLSQLFLAVAGRLGDSQVEYERSKQLQGSRGRWEWAALLRVWAADTDPVRLQAQFDDYLDSDHETSAELTRELYGVRDQPEAASEVVRRALNDPVSQLSGRMTVVFLSADVIGDKDLALEAMRRAFVDLEKVNYEGLWWPFVTDLRTDPRFKEIVREIGLADYWRTSGNWGDFARPVGPDDFQIIR